MKRITLTLLMMTVLFLAACRDADTAVATPTSSVVGETLVGETAVPQAADPAATPSPVPSATPQPTATPIPPKELTVCMNRPQSLYLYGDASIAAVAIRHAIYENLITSLGYDYQPQGLEKLPTAADGDLTMQPVTVNFGDPVVDYRGDVHVLREGLTVFDSSGELVTVTDRPVEMQQVTAVFTLKPLVWSDGVPVSADDSVFSFHLAANPDTPGDKRKVQRTAVYEATGPLTLRWTGLPGYIPGDVVAHVWPPLPQHQLGNTTAADLLTSPDTTIAPLSSGPFVISASAENGLTLLRNPHYYRAADGLPYLDILNVTFVDDGAALLAGGLAGCDVTTQDLLPFTDLAQVQAVDGVNTAVTLSAAYEHIDFSVNFYLAEGFENFIRPDWFQDPRVRQGITQCTDRQRMVDEIFGGETAVMPAYIPANHPLYPADLPQWPYDAAAGNALLDAAGYVDSDSDGIRNDPTTGEVFSVRLTTDDQNSARAQAAAIFSENMADCGIGVTVDLLPPEDWYNDGPLGLLFGRRFELGMFAWLGAPAPTCQLWLERNITGPLPDGFGGWGNVNVSGWANADFEAACNAALNSLPGTPEYAAAQQSALQIWAQQLPMIPLFNYIKLTAARPTVTGLHPDATQLSELWNVVEWDVSN